jgi:hypothetical protein
MYNKPFETKGKPFKNTILGKIIIGASDAFTGGTVSNIIYADENTQAGQIDWKKAGASISTVILIISFIAGKIKFEDLIQVIDLIK